MIRHVYMRSSDTDLVRWTNRRETDSHYDEQRQDDQQEPIYNSSVPMQDATLKAYRIRWTKEKGGGRGSGISVLLVRHDVDDDDIYIYIYIYIYILIGTLGIFGLSPKTYSLKSIYFEAFENSLGTNNLSLILVGLNVLTRITINNYQIQ